MSNAQLNGVLPALPAKEKLDIHDAVLYAGVVLIVTGCALLSVPVGIIVAGIALVALAFVSE